MPVIALMGSLDTKGLELQYLKSKLLALGSQPLLIDISVGGSSDIAADISAQEVLALAGADCEQVHRMGRSEAIQTVSIGAMAMVKKCLTERRINGIITICGGTGSAVCNAVFDMLPFGFPKVMLSSLPPLMGSAERLTLNDTLFLRSIVDVAGLNTIMRTQMDYAAVAIHALAGYAKTAAAEQEPHKKPRVAMTMFGVTTPCIETVQDELLRAGYDPYIFHANGDGGFQMERLMRQGFFDAVLDLTLAEVVPEFFRGASCYGGPDRLKVAGELNLPRLYVPGALDVVNYLDIPASERYDRVWHMHTPALKVLRPNAQDSEKIGALVAQRINIGQGPVAVVLPLKGLSQTDYEGHPCYDKQANDALFTVMKQTLRPQIPVTSLDYHINDPAFGKAVAKIFMEKILPL